MISFIRKNQTFIYIAAVYALIFFQYPAYIAISRLVLHQGVDASIQPSYLLLWGLIRILIVIPLLFTLLAKENIDHEDLYLSFGNSKKVISITFWGTFIFTFLGIILYPWFINETTLTALRFVEYLPIFMLYAVTNAFIEETFFRGIAIRFLTDKSKFWIANLIQSFFFALIHIVNPMTSSPWLFVALTFFLGLGWGYLTKRYKSLVPAIALHVIADIFVAISLF